MALRFEKKILKITLPFAGYNFFNNVNEKESKWMKERNIVKQIEKQEKILTLWWGSQSL